MIQFLNKIFGDENKKTLKSMEKIVEQINEQESKIQNISTENLPQKTKELEEKLKNGASLEELVPEIFALVREASQRTPELKLEHPTGSLGLRHFDVQLIGGLVLHQGKIAEMRTGEGKTLVATLAAYANAISKKGVHVITVNDYLARRDTTWMGAVYHMLGLQVSCIQNQAAFMFDPNYIDDEKGHHYLRPITRKEAYSADITYGTNNEFGFDYLRDNMVQDIKRKVQRPLHYAIVDEIDSILIDEARTPLIISAPAERAAETYYKFATLVDKLKENEDYNVDEKMKAATLSEEGIKKMEQWLGVDNIYEKGGVSTVHHIEQALKARALFKKDKDYVVKDGEIIIVDEFTGRLMIGRRYSEGLHQAIEAKENVQIKQESVTLATITFQNYFRMYKKLSGMTGTAMTESEEFHKIYGLDVIEIPTHRPIQRKDLSDKIYKTEMGKLRALVKDVKERNQKGQPVLIGTVSIEKNELLSALLTKEGVKHEVLNAKNHEREAQIIAQAGKSGSVTVATNMAGRGTDIVLGGNPSTKEDEEKVKSLGGLVVYGSERHEARRIDNQLRGRSGRLGDPGETQFYVSMEDDLMRIFGSDRIRGLMDKLGLPEDAPIENKMITNSIASAQKKVETHHFDIRKHLVEYDDIVNKHREVIYKRRNAILGYKEEETKQEITRLLQEEIETVVSFHTALENPTEWNIQEILEVTKTILPIEENLESKLKELQKQAKDKLEEAKVRTSIIDLITKKALEKYQKVEDETEHKGVIRKIEKALMLRAIDVLWIEHLETMAHLREGIGLRGYGQRDPLIEYKKEGYNLFTELQANINKQIVYSALKIQSVKKMPDSPMSKDKHITSAPAKEGGSKESKKQAPAKSEKPRTDSGKKIGRNDPCFCGSGKKYKKCHGK